MDRYHQQLLEPSTYPEPTRSVAFTETHVSRVYLTDRHAYKFKKPLDLGFLDFSSLDKRRHFCREEVRLNRRFAPDTYLGVIELRQQNGTVRFGKIGKLVDYAVRMRRLPEKLMLNRLIESKAPGLPDEMPRLAQALHQVFLKADICRDEPVRNVKVVTGNCAENFLQTKAAIGFSLTEEAHGLMHKVTENALHDLQEAMQEREEEGFVRDGHGDLHTANICMTTPVCIYDCIEFCRRFRVADIAADLAFLLMDCDFRGRRDLAERAAMEYLAVSGDRGVARLLPFYKGYRAWVRGKVNAILAADPEAMSEAREHAALKARRYFNLALGYQLQPTLFLLTGLMGVGKTTLASALVEACGARLLRSDVVRKQLAGRPELVHVPDDFASGLYSAESSRATYEQLFRAAAEGLAGHRSVIVDASFASADQRSRFQELADRSGLPAWLLHLECTDEIALGRLDQRGEDASDGRRDLYLQQKAVFSPIVPTAMTLAVDASDPIDYNVQMILCRVLSHQEPHYEKGQ